MRLEIGLEAGLAEYDIGEGAGLTPSQLREKFPELLKSRARGERFLFPGEEGRDAFHERLADALERPANSKGPRSQWAHGGVICATATWSWVWDLGPAGRLSWSATARLPRSLGTVPGARRSRDTTTCATSGIETTVDRG
ncbi:histidine phosphatase family protein [Candidatus Amarobacter glycogenicus]|uniref:histidine phosphatase family protein n=1 Tax=Candidatus Amarobacter glycogenicus TaxID=3140699 RepID=UPI0031CCC985